MRHVMSAAALALVVFAATAHTASADVSRGVIAAFKGQIVVSKDELPTGKNDKDTISQIKKAQLKELTGTAGEDNTTWNFHYTAFLTKTGAKNLKLEFMKGKQLAADKQLDGIDPKSGVLSGDITIDENEGLAKGSTYQVNLMSGSSIVAKTTLIMK